jgi:hypothetical protein
MQTAHDPQVKQGTRAKLPETSTPHRHPGWRPLISKSTERRMPDHEPAVGLMSDPRVRRMIEAWFELEKMEADLIPGPHFAERLKKCGERIRSAIMHLASEAMSESLAEAKRTGGRYAVSAFWMEAVTRGETETAAALADLWTT